MQELVNKLPDFSNSTSSFMSSVSASIHKQVQQIQPQIFEGLMDKKVRREIARKLMDTLEPTVVKLEPGSIKKLNENIIAEKTDDGKIILYEVTS